MGHGARGIVIRARRGYFGTSVAGRRRNHSQASLLLWLRASLQAMGVSRQTLADALKRVAQGDKSAFELVYAATSVKLYGIIVRILGRRDLADEVLQEVYIRVWQRARQFDPAAGSPITWLTSIARNRALDETKRKTMRSLEELPGLEEISSWDEAVKNHRLNDERTRLLACLDRLDPHKKQVILLAYHYGMTREEIARHVGRPVATVKTWLRRGLAQLKECLDE
jgi:RNA polymerase sigma-70 factor (ECF subfamily)